jgi:carbonic anhydrase
MIENDNLISGYRQFRQDHYSRYRDLYDTLADKGQAPKTMIVSCCDSRVEPAAIFNAKPGEMFVVRNVANLVPPYTTIGDYSGTRAALEFAVCGLNVEHIVVLGHGQCGGIKAYLQGLNNPDAGGKFIGKWMSILKSTRDHVVQSNPGTAPEQLQLEMEYAAIQTSLNNLTKFPFIQERLKENRLQFHGGHFDIAKGELYSLDRKSGQFNPVK